MSKTSFKFTELNPETDYEKIVYNLACYEFPWDIHKSLELAFFRTFAVPSISKLLFKTGEFIRRPQKRYDDTELILYEIMENGFDSSRAKSAISRLNQMHGMFDISNEDYLYVLSTFVYEPIRWIDQFGWRSLTENEKLAIFIFFSELGQRMNIKEIPEDFTEFEKYNLQFEKAHFKYAPDNQKIAESLQKLFLSFYLPSFLYFLGKPFVNAVMDDQMLKSCGLNPSRKSTKAMVQSVLKLRSRIIKFLPKRRSPFLGTKVIRKTYPDGYKIEKLGTFEEDLVNTNLNN